MLAAQVVAASSAIATAIFAVIIGSQRKVSNEQLCTPIPFELEIPMEQFAIGSLRSRQAAEEQEQYSTDSTEEQEQRNMQPDHPMHGVLQRRLEYKAMV